MLTGTDEHGLKLEREAQARGMDAAAFVDEMSDRFEATWPKLEVEPTTSSARRSRATRCTVQELWRRVEKNGDLYLGTYEGRYCVGCEEFKTEKELLPGNVCPLHKTPIEWQGGDVLLQALEVPGAAPRALREAPELHRARDAGATRS